MNSDLSEARWRTSSYSNNGGACVEAAFGHTDLVPVRDSKDPGGAVLIFTAEAWAAFTAGVREGDFEARGRWRKSSHSQSGGDCVEVALRGATGTTAVRDSKDPGGSVLRFTAQGWAHFVAAVRDGEFGEV